MGPLLQVISSNGKHPPQGQLDNSIPCYFIFVEWDTDITRLIVFLLFINFCEIMIKLNCDKKYIIHHMKLCYQCDKNTIEIYE